MNRNKLSEYKYSEYRIIVFFDIRYINMIVFNKMIFR